MAAMGATTLIMVMVVMAMVLRAPKMASGSRFWTYAGPGCDEGVVREYGACGCSNIAGDTHGGYRFTYQGQTANAYNSANCQGDVHTHFSGSTEGCSPFGWQSFFIQC